MSISSSALGRRLGRLRRRIDGVAARGSSPVLGSDHLHLTSLDDEHLVALIALSHEIFPGRERARLRGRVEKSARALVRDGSRRSSSDTATSRASFGSISISSARTPPLVTHECARSVPS